MSNSDKHTIVLDELKTMQGSTEGLTNREIHAVAHSHGVPPSEIYQIFITASTKVKRGVYDMNLVDLTNEIADDSSEAAETPAPAESMAASFALANSLEECFVPAVDPTFVSWGESDTVQKIISSKMFMPTYVAGLSGNGKTLMIEQACAKLKREYVRVQVSPETDEDDLLGGFRLIGGETIFHEGPVIKAMRAGAILLIDEIDRGTNKIMCLQGVLEGKPIMIKKTGQMVRPAPGFNILATANTKGRGGDDGRYSAANIIDDAFIERFTLTIEQEYPSPTIEKNILTRSMKTYEHQDLAFIDRLIEWAKTVRDTFSQGGVDETISTRRLVHIIKTFAIFKDRSRAIKMCVARFDEVTRDSFVSLYERIDKEVAAQEARKEAERRAAEEAKKRAAEREEYLKNNPSTSNSTLQSAFGGTLPASLPKDLVLCEPPF